MAKSSASKEMPTDPVIVIGAGMGGLAAAISLAARKIPVVLLERHPRPGGKMRQVFVAAQGIDSGPTVFTMRWVFESLFARAGLKLEEHLGLDKADLLARHSWQNSESLDLFATLNQSMQAIAEFASDKDADNYRKFARKTEAVFNTLDSSFMRAQRPNPIALSLQGGLRGMVDMANTQPFVSLWNSLSRDFEDPRLRQLFARYATYCGSSPFKAPATLMLIAHVEKAGVWMVQGGMQSLANTLSDTLISLGGELRFGCGVSRMEVKDKQIVGVHLDNDEFIPAQAVVFNGDTQALAKGLLGDEATRAASARAEPSLSAVTRCQYAVTSGYTLAHHTVFFGNDYADEFDSVFERGSIADRPTVYVCAQDRSGSADTQVADGQHERLFSLVNAPARPMSKAQRMDAIEKMQDTLNSQGLEILDEQGKTIVTDPGQFGRLFPASDGALYGRPTHGWMGSFKRPGSKSRLKGLYLCGGSVHPGAGVPMATLSGQLAADRLCKDWNIE
ncbi:MAG: 1-hydroxycarotenoid 3,4-desaturase CrtD [Granulosicoccus sp.]